jgi:hypothetical protein
MSGLALALILLAFVTAGLCVWAWRTGRPAPTPGKHTDS